MNHTTTVLAFDVGASSGRAILATYDAGNLTYEEIHRFENNPVEQNGTLYWDFPMLLQEVKKAIALAQKKGFYSLGFDTWGVDFGLLDEQGALIALPVHYRDKRANGLSTKITDPLALYEETGIQMMDINTLFQLMAAFSDPQVQQRAKHLLFMPDLFVYYLCGHRACDPTIASTSALMQCTQQVWSPTLPPLYHIPASILPPIVPCGTVTGKLPTGETILTIAGHDTQCAVAAMPPTKGEPAFVSCGTWSLIGCELDAPLCTSESFHAGFSNEQGANGKINYLKNTVGLWLIQESRRAYAREGVIYSYGDLERRALEADSFCCWIDPDDPLFLAPGDMPARVRTYCKQTGQPVPETVGAVMSCIYESLAFKYRATLEQLTQQTKKQWTVLHILGGGAKDGLLCQMAANSCGLPVKAGPVEATALGNVLIQLVALGVLPSIDAGRTLLEKTEHIQEYKPKDTLLWANAYEQYKKITLPGGMKHDVS